MKYLFFLTIFIFFAVLVVCFSYRPSRIQTSNWISLATGVAVTIPHGAKFTALQLNGQTLQTKLTCDACPAALNVEQQLPSGTVYKLKLNNLLRHDTLDTLKVICEYEPRWAHLPINPTYTFLIKTECDVIYQLIYDKIVENISNKKVSHATIDTLRHLHILDINEILAQLTQDELSNWMKIQKNQSSDLKDSFNTYCYQYFKVLKYVGDGEQNGFKPRKYNLKDSSLHNNSALLYLQTIASMLESMATHFNLLNGTIAIYVTGYADTTKINGVVRLNKESEQDHIVYEEDCSEKEDSQPKFTPFNKLQSSKSLVDIHNNCELSAVRGYYATKFLQQKLGTAIGNSQIFYYYRGGGVVKGSDLAANRKVHVGIQFNAIQQTQ